MREETCSITEIVEEDRHLCSMADPEGQIGGARYKKCYGAVVAAGKVGEPMCREHAESYPEPQFVLWLK